MSSNMSLPDPGRFGLATFAQILPERPPITGEDPGSFQGFHAGLLQSLAPMTPYECVIAENLIAIEWELIQHRRMRDAGLRRNIRYAICKAVRDQRFAAYDAQMDEDWERFVAEGGDEDAWEAPFEFETAAAEQAGDALAARAMDHDPTVQAEAYEEISGLGLSPLDLMTTAHRGYPSSHEDHDEKVRDLERRRREVKRDYDALLKSRPIDGEVIDG